MFVVTASFGVGLAALPFASRFDLSVAVYFAVSGDCLDCLLLHLVVFLWCRFWLSVLRFV